jgi:sushi domain-containing protein 2
LLTRSYSSVVRFLSSLNLDEILILKSLSILNFLSASSPSKAATTNQFALYAVAVDADTRTLSYKMIDANLSLDSARVTLNKLVTTVTETVDLIGKKFKSAGNYLVIGALNSNMELVNWEYMKKFEFFNETNSNAKCLAWYASEPDPAPYMNSLPPCIPNINTNFPPTIEVFTQDESCNPQNPKYCATYHPGAKGCYRSAPNSGLNGSRQQCCYDTQGILIKKPPGAGTLDLSSNLIGHFLKDVKPYFHCCKYSNNCDKYYEKRPLDDGSRYVPPRPSGGSGDPHFLTLDGLGYTFNGYGEYVLLQIDQIGFSIQVRLHPYKSSRGTVFTGIALSGRGIDRVQVELNSITNDLEFYINGLIANEGSEFNLVLNGISVVGSSKSFSFICINGISVQAELTETLDSFYVVTVVPSKFKRQTKGLLGFMDGQTQNDFTLPDGTVLQLDSNNDKVLFNAFGNKWRNTANNTLFVYSEGFSHASFVDYSYEPLFLSDGIEFENKTLENLAKQVCGNNTRCLFDVSTTEELSIGHSSLNFEKEIEDLEEQFASKLR